MMRIMKAVIILVVGVALGYKLARRVAAVPDVTPTVQKAAHLLEQAQQALVQERTRHDREVKGIQEEIVKQHAECTTVREQLTARQAELASSRQQVKGLEERMVADEAASQVELAAASHRQQDEVDRLQKKLDEQRVAADALVQGLQSKVASQQHQFDATVTAVREQLEAQDTRVADLIRQLDRAHEQLAASNDTANAKDQEVQKAKQQAAQAQADLAAAQAKLSQSEQQLATKASPAVTPRPVYQPVAPAWQSTPTAVPSATSTGSVVRQDYQYYRVQPPHVDLEVQISSWAKQSRAWQEHGRPVEVPGWQSVLKDIAKQTRQPNAGRLHSEGHREASPKRQ